MTANNGLLPSQLDWENAHIPQRGDAGNWYMDVPSTGQSGGSNTCDSLIPARTVQQRPNPTHVKGQSILTNPFIEPTTPEPSSNASAAFDQGHHASTYPRMTQHSRLFLETSSVDGSSVVNEREDASQTSSQATIGRGSKISDQQQSDSVVNSEKNTPVNPPKPVAEPDIWIEEATLRGLRGALKNSSVQWVETYNGAVDVLAGLNPETYHMPQESYVVNIKTEFSANILQSIHCGYYSVGKNVSDRIMNLWKDRKPHTKIIFLFSINGGKKFTGLAEMAGPWDRNVRLDNWRTPKNGPRCVGRFPVTWIYAKDVAYQQFAHIKQPETSNHVGNMWNGITFAMDVGREVIKTYVQIPAMTTILGYPKNWYDGSFSCVGNNTVSAGNNIVSAGNNTVSSGNNTVSAGNNTVSVGNNTVSVEDNTVCVGDDTARNSRASGSSRNSRNGSSGGSSNRPTRGRRPALEVKNWRVPHNTPVSVKEDEGPEPAPIASNPHHGPQQNAFTTVPQFNGPGSAPDASDPHYGSQQNAFTTVPQFNGPGPGPNFSNPRNGSQQTTFPVMQEFNDPATGTYHAFIHNPVNAPPLGPRGPPPFGPHGHPPYGPPGLEPPPNGPMGPPVYGTVHDTAPNFVFVDAAPGSTHGQADRMGASYPDNFNMQPYGMGPRGFQNVPRHFMSQVPHQGPIYHPNHMPGFAGFVWGFQNWRQTPAFEDWSQHLNAWYEDVTTRELNLELLLKQVGNHPSALLAAKYNRVRAEKYEVEMEMMQLRFPDVDVLMPEDLESINMNDASGGQAGTSGGGNRHNPTTPAPNSRGRHGATAFGSPVAPARRANREGHGGFTRSWNERMVNDMEKIVGS